MFSKFVKVVFVVVLLGVLLSACGTSGKPQPVCKTSAPLGSQNGAHWVAVPDSVSVNNPRGICELKDADGDVLNRQAGEKSFDEFVAQLKNTAKKAGDCATSGQATTCAYGELNNK